MYRILFSSVTRISFEKWLVESNIERFFQTNDVVLTHYNNFCSNIIINDDLDFAGSNIFTRIFMQLAKSE